MDGFPTLVTGVAEGYFYDDTRAWLGGISYWLRTSLPLSLAISVSSTNKSMLTGLTGIFIMLVKCPVLYTSDVELTTVWR